MESDETPLKRTREYDEEPCGSSTKVFKWGSTFEQEVQTDLNFVP